MTEFRLTQISDTHLARRFASLTRNFDRVRDHIDATRPDLVLNTGDLGFDAPTSPDDLDYAKSLHDALPVPCRYLPGNHDIGDNPTAGRTCADATRQREGTARPISRCSATTAGVSRRPAGASSGSIRW